MHDVIELHSKRSIIGVYKDTDPLFYWALVVNGKLKPLGEYYTCRESLAQYARDCFNKEEKTNDINFNNMSIGILKFGTSSDVKLERAHNILNLVEEHYGWVKTKMWFVDKTQCYKPASASSVDTYAMAYFKGSRKWLKSSHMISLFALILRVGMRRNFVNVTTFEDFKKKILQSRSSENDIRWMRNAIHSMDIILGQYKKLFRDMPTKRMYDTNVLNESYTAYSEGINLLCTRKTNDRKLLNRFVAISRKYNAKKATAAGK